MLNIEEFNKIMAGDVFAKGEIENSPEGIYMTNSSKYKMLGWVAKKGFGNDWSIYTHWAEKGYEFIESNGDKVYSKANIQKLVPCTDAVMKLYRF